MLVNILNGESTTNSQVDGLNLVNRQGQAIDASYNGRKYQVLCVDSDYYSLSERIERFCKAFFQVLFTLGFVLCNKGKRTEIYALFCATIKSQQINVTRYKKNSDQQHKQVLDLINKAFQYGTDIRSYSSKFRDRQNQKDCLNEIMNKCKEIGYYVNLNQWQNEEIRALFATRNINIIAHFLAKHRGALNISVRQASLALRECIARIVPPVKANAKEKKDHILNVCNIVKTLVASGADVNKTFSEIYGNRDSILSICLRAIVDSHPLKDEIRYVNNYCGFAYPLLELKIELEKRGFTWPTDGSSPSDADVADLPELDEDTQNALPKPTFKDLLNLWAAESAKKANPDEGQSDEDRWKLPTPEQFQEFCNSLCESLLVDFRPIIALLVSCGAKTTIEITPEDEMYWEHDYGAICDNILARVREELKAMPSLLTLLLGHEDEGSSFASLPRDPVLEIAKKMLPPLNVDIRKVVGWA